MNNQQLKLKNILQFWYQHQPTKENFNQSLTPVATVSTVQQFWNIYQHCKRPSSLDDNSYLYLFKNTIKPVWQDPQNQQGGSFILRFPKENSDQVWEDILIGFIALNINENTSINGIRSKIRKDIQIIEIWIPNIDNQEQLEKVKQWILQTTKLNQETSIEVIKFNIQ